MFFNYFLIYTKLFVNKISKELITTSNGNEAVEICRKNPDIDLILMDIRIPKMNGYETTQKIREFNQDVVIFAQTAFALVGYREKAIEAGCKEYISKPLDKNQLRSLIEKYF